MNGNVAVAAGTMTILTSVSLVAERAQDWQAFWGIVFAAVTLFVFVWASIRNQRRQDEKLEETKRHNKVLEANLDIHRNRNTE